MAQFTPMSISRFNDDPDSPLLLLAKPGEAGPQFLLLIVDARNGKDTWSLREDAAVFCLALAAPTTIQQVFLDEGFASRGKPSGQFIAAGPEAAEEMIVRLMESHRRSRGLARLGQPV